MAETKQNEARNAQREYMRKWRHDNPEKVRAAQMRYWQKKAEQMKAAVAKKGEQYE